jgi:hypothetical protein
MLWHVVAIEAVIGDTSPRDLTNKLARRISNSLGHTDEQRKELRESFSRLYAYRSHMIHGSSTSFGVDKGQLALARNLATQCVTWSLLF